MLLEGWKHAVTVDGFPIDPASGKTLVKFRDPNGFKGTIPLEDFAKLFNGNAIVVYDDNRPIAEKLSEGGDSRSKRARKVDDPKAKNPAYLHR